MDRKTLEYLEERAQQGRELVNRIEELQTIASRLIGYSTASIQFRDQHGTTFEEMKKSKQGDAVVSSVVSAAVKAAREEIERLERRLAEL